MVAFIGQHRIRRVDMATGCPINRIVQIDPDKYREEEISAVLPNCMKNSSERTH
jgi:hypothetical protein